MQDQVKCDLYHAWFPVLTPSWKNFSPPNSHMTFSICHMTLASSYFTLHLTCVHDLSSVLDDEVFKNRIFNHLYLCEFPECPVHTGWCRYGVTISLTPSSLSFLFCKTLCQVGLVVLVRMFQTESLKTILTLLIRRKNFLFVLNQ